MVDVNEPAMAEPKTELEALREENANFRTWGIIEIAVRNPQVSEYMNHWEGRVATLSARVAELERENARLAPKPTPHDHLAGVCYRWGEPTADDYQEAIVALTEAKQAIATGDHSGGCGCCGDSGHTVMSCHHNPLLLARQWTAATRLWQCYHCGFIATNDDEARAHFGLSEQDDPSCATARASALEAEVERLRELLDCARGEYEMGNGRIIDNADPHWSVQARAARGKEGE